MSEATEDAKKSLARIQDFDVESLIREEELGTSLDFRQAVPHAIKLIGFYKRLSREVVDDLPDGLANQIKSQADADFNRFQEILAFETTVGNPSEVRDQLIQQIQNAYDSTFSTLHPLISYGSSVTLDVQRMENDARAMIQSVQDQAENITEELSDRRDQAQGILDDIRKIAAEQGVSQQAIHFREESESHAEQSEHWGKRTIYLALGLGAYAFLSFFFHKIPWIRPETTIQTIQLVASKILVFAVISYMLFLSARNFMSHKHNAIVNKHRQNALATFQALVDAAHEEANQDVILTHASACIFSPQDTGYAKSGSSSSASDQSVVGLLPKTMVKLVHRGRSYYAYRLRGLPV